MPALVISMGCGCKGAAACSGSIRGLRLLRFVRRIAARSGQLTSLILLVSPTTFPPDYADLKSDGWGALARYRASDPRLFDYAASDGEASIPMDKQNPHFTNRARGGFTGAAMIEVIRRNRKAACRC